VVSPGWLANELRVPVRAGGTSGNWFAVVIGASARIKSGQWKCEMSLPRRSVLHPTHPLSGTDIIFTKVPSGSTGKKDSRQSSDWTPQADFSMGLLAVGTCELNRQIKPSAPRRYGVAASAGEAVKFCRSLLSGLNGAVRFLLASGRDWRGDNDDYSSDGDYGPVIGATEARGMNIRQLPPRPIGTAT
jgi:hypothetical protein